LSKDAGKAGFTCEPRVQRSFTFVYELWGEVEEIVEEIGEKLDIERDGRTDVEDR
jgi:hypothetical protein